MEVNISVYVVRTILTFIHKLFLHHGVSMIVVSQSVFMLKNALTKIKIKKNLKYLRMRKIYRDENNTSYSQLSICPFALSFMFAK